MSRLAGAPVASMTVTWVMAVTRSASDRTRGVALARPAPTAAPAASPAAPASTERREMLLRCMAGPFALCGAFTIAREVGPGHWRERAYPG